MPLHIRLSRAILGFAALVALAAAAHADVLDDVKTNGVVKCGVTLAAAGFSAEDNAGQRQGFDIDLCKAIAAAAVGDATKIQLTPMDLKTAFAGLPTGVVDVLTHRFTWTQSRDVSGLKFPKIMFFDGQGFVVTKKSKASKIADLNNVASSSFSGAIFGALFLQRFVTEARSWAHLDLYAWNGKERPGRPVGAEPQAVRALYAFLKHRYAR